MRKVDLQVVNNRIAIARGSRSSRDIANAILALSNHLGVSYNIASGILYSRTGLHSPRECSSERFIPTGITPAVNLDDDIGGPVISPKDMYDL